MKTILVIIAGMADLADPRSHPDTPLSAAKVPALDALTERGHLYTLSPVDRIHEATYKNALLSILGYDLKRGIPSTEELMEYGLDNSSALTDYSSLRPFIIPGFSGHGVCITTSAWVRGVAKCALLKPLDIYSPGSSESEILETIAGLVNDSLNSNDFVLVYVDSPLKASLQGNYDAKVHALETIDRHLVGPVADFVWKSDLLINMAVTTDLVTPWYRQKPLRTKVPALLYYNNLEENGSLFRIFTEEEAVTSELGYDLNSPSEFIRHLAYLNMKEGEEDSDSSDMPF